MERLNRPPLTTLPPATARSISRDEINALAIQRYEGVVHMVASPAEIRRATDDICRARIVGFDTETRPAFRSGESYRPSLVQFATSDAVYLFQVQQQDCSVLMREVFSSNEITKVGVSVKDDIINLKRLFTFEETKVVDLGRIAKSHGLKQTGVRNLAGIFLGIRIPKGGATTNWAARRLTERQISYAATDAWVCRELYLRFEQLKLV